jgi:ribosomal-protein-alanine N-acetyltransferase
MTDRSALIIRPMQVDDIPSAIEIADSLLDAPHWPIAAYQAALNPNSEPHRIALVAETPKADTPHSGAVVGFIVASVVAGEAELESIAVAADAQRRGIGGQLLSHLLAALTVRKVKRINLEVRASNHPALGLYTRHGFAQAGSRAAYYADPVEDAALLSRDLV